MHEKHLFFCYFEWKGKFAGKWKAEKSFSLLCNCVMVYLACECVGGNSVCFLVRCVLCVTCYSDLTHTFLVFLANCCQMQFYPRNCISCCWYCEIVNKISPISSLTVYELRVVSLQIANSKQNRIQDKAPHWRFFVPWMWTN